MALNAVIIDDELHARENLSMLISEYCPDLQVVGTGNDVGSGLDVIREQDPDVVFLDIRMPSGAEGFELLRKIESPRFMVVFVTAFKDYAIDAFKVNAVDYILKPIDIDELIETVNRLTERLKSFKDEESKAQVYRDTLDNLSQEMVKRSERIAISHATGVKLVRIEDIIFLKAEGNCTSLYFKDGGSYLDTHTLKYYETELIGHPYFRIHRSYLINLNELKEFSRQEGNHVVMSNGSTLPVARNQVTELLAIIKEL